MCSDSQNRFHLGLDTLADLQTYALMGLETDFAVALIHAHGDRQV